MSNNMRTPKEKEEIVKEYYLIGQAKICHKYNISKSVIWNWVKKYEEKGIKVPPSSFSDGKKDFLRASKVGLESVAFEVNRLKMMSTSCGSDT